MKRAISFIIIFILFALLYQYTVVYLQNGHDVKYEIEIDDNSDTFGVSFSGSKKEMKCFRKIAKDLYMYYGVSEDDIKNKTERYLSLVCILSM